MLSMSSADLWSGTGFIHCLVGLSVPELRDPLLRLLRDGTVETAGQSVEERYARSAALWFQLFGVMVILQGFAWKQQQQHNKNNTREITGTKPTKTDDNEENEIDEDDDRELPGWWGWSVTALGVTMGKLMPGSGWPIVLAQGVRIVWRNRNNNTNNNNQKPIEGNK